MVEYPAEGLLGHGVLGGIRECIANGVGVGGAVSEADAGEGFADVKALALGVVMAVVGFGKGGVGGVFAGEQSAGEWYAGDEAAALGLRGG